MRVKHNLDPIYNKKSKILILGSMPSIISRQNYFYYANKSNRFWKIISKLFNCELNTNNDKKKFLLNNKIAMWDVIKECDINGSSDSSITNIVYNDIFKVLKHSNIEYIFCLGKKAYTLFVNYYGKEKNVFYLPSPSSANASYSLIDLVENYKIIRDTLY